jgi:hypothetical protein
MPKKPPIPIPARPRWKPAGRVVLALALVAGTVLVFNLLGGEALRSIGLNHRYRTRFADIQCDTPRGLDHGQFLNEVRYLSGYADVVHALDEGERRGLSAAFAKHPWVDSVQAVEVMPGNAVRVSLNFREPVLAVRTDGGTIRMVDSRGVLLPDSEPPHGLPELLNLVPAPGVSAGEPWPEETVLQALALLKAHSAVKLERTASGWRLTKKDGGILDLPGP